MRQLMATLLVGLLMIAGASAPSAAAEDPEGSILVIMDVSGSMAREDGSGTVLMEGARTAVDGLLDSLPDDANIGLRLYGHSYPGDDLSEGCKDTELVVPVGGIGTTGSKVRKAINNAKPLGWTPIGTSLRQAQRDFPPEGERTVILVSDGEGTCDDPTPL